jgi:hypothetical protein
MSAAKAVAAPPPSAADLPDADTLVFAAKLSKSLDWKPISLDYYGPSFEGLVHVGVQPSKARSLVKSAEEYTSNIIKIRVNKGLWFVETANTLYIVKGDLKQKTMKEVSDSGSDSESDAEPRRA